MTILTNWTWILSIYHIKWKTFSFNKCVLFLVDAQILVLLANWKGYPNSFDPNAYLVNRNKPGFIKWIVNLKLQDLVLSRQWCWWHLLKVGDAHVKKDGRCWWPKWPKPSVTVRHQYLIIVTNTFRLQHQCNQFFRCKVKSEIDKANLTVG